MTWHSLAAALYAPIRVLLREDTEGNVAFEHGRPATTFGQSGNPDVDCIAGGLDAQFRTTLAATAGKQTSG